MTQNTETDMLALPSAESELVDAPTMVEAYAVRLMDDLFEDVDRLLEGDESALAAFNTPEADPVPVAETPATLTAEASLAVPSDPLSAITLPFEAEAPAPAPAPPSRWQSWPVRLLLVGLASSLVGGAAFWLMNRQPSRPLVAQTAGDAPAVEAPGQTNAEFADYLRRSLEVLDTKADQAGTEAIPSPADLPQVAVLPSQPLAGTSGGAGLPGNPASSGSSSLNVIERVYIPYQAPVAQAPQVQPQPTAPAPTPAAPPTTTATAPTSPASTNVHVLVGVLELGDRSAALFEVNGVAQRVYIGERIAGSGWNLVSVSNQEAVIRRNGEVRSVYVGQQF